MTNRDYVLQKIEEAENQIEILENSLDKLRAKLAQTCENGAGVLVEYDYDYGWNVSTFEDGEWEIYDYEHQNLKFHRAVTKAEELAKHLGCGLLIDPYKPKKKKKSKKA